MIAIPLVIASSEIIPLHIVICAMTLDLKQVKVFQAVVYCVRRKSWLKIKILSTHYPTDRC